MSSAITGTTRIKVLLNHQLNSGSPVERRFVPTIVVPKAERPHINAIDSAIRPRVRQPNT
jgi:hypothetical protein